MKVKELFVHLKFPYSLDTYQKGHVEIGETIVLEKGDDPDTILDELFETVKDKVIEKVDQIIEEWEEA
jgi:hypothetical protein